MGPLHCTVSLNGPPKSLKWRFLGLCCFLSVWEDFPGSQVVIWDHAANPTDELQAEESCYEFCTFSSPAAANLEVTYGDGSVGSRWSLCQPGSLSDQGEQSLRTHTRSHKPRVGSVPGAIFVVLGQWGQGVRGGSHNWILQGNLAFSDSSKLLA